MEFDTKINLRKVDALSVVSSLGEEDFMKKVREILSSKASAVGDDAGGAFWADYSTSLVTRHLKCDVTLPEGSGEEQTKYNVKISAGKKPSYILDVILCFLALAVVWGFSKALVPEPPTYSYVVILCACCALGLIIAMFGKAFGVKEGKEVGDAIRSQVGGK